MQNIVVFGRVRYCLRHGPECLSICITYSLSMGDHYEIEGEEIVEREVKPFGSGGAHLTAPKRWLGATVKIVRVTDPDSPDDTDENA